jgi:dihydroflavonol-4-reductase
VKVLVTGSSGFIGSALCRALVEKGHDVRAFHRPTSLLKLLEGLPVEHVCGSLNKTEDVRSAVEGMEAVFHCSAYFSRREDPGTMYSLVVEGTRSLLQAARTAGVKRLVYTSSSAALGIPEEATISGPVVPALLDESHTWNYRPQDWYYAYARYMAELEVQQAVALGLDAVIVNPTLVLGAGDIYRRSASLLVQVGSRRVPALITGGLNAVHLQDVVEGHLAALERGQNGQRYLLGGENLTHKELLDIMAEVTGVDPPHLVYPVRLARFLSGPLRLLQPFMHLPVSGRLLKLAGLHFYYNTRKAQTALGLSAPRPVRQAVQEAFDWFKETGAIS